MRDPAAPAPWHGHGDDLYTSWVPPRAAPPPARQDYEPRVRTWTSVLDSQGAMCAYLPFALCVWLCGTTKEGTHIVSACTVASMASPVLLRARKLRAQPATHDTHMLTEAMSAWCAFV